MSSSARQYRRSLGNHVPLVLKLGREADLPPGSVAEVVVAHDAWCRINRGRPCNCVPDVRLVTRPDVRSN